MVSRSYEIREKLEHPIIDSDGHWAELYPVYRDYVRELGGPAVLARFDRVYGRRMGAWYEASPEGRLRNRMRRPSYWGVPTSRDRIATLVPRVTLLTGCAPARGFDSLPFYLRGSVETQQVVGHAG